MPLTRRLGRAALVVLTSAFAASPLLLPRALGAQPVHADTTLTPQVKRLDLVGVSATVDEQDLRSSIATTATTCKSVLLLPFCKLTRYHGFKNREYLDHKELARDLLRIRVWYYQQGYREARADTTVKWLNDKRVAVTFTIVEGPPTMVTDVAVKYDSSIISPGRIKELTLLHTGDPLNLRKLDSMRVFFQDALWEHGYADALVDTATVVNAAARTALVQVDLVHNHLTRVGTIDITGTDQVSRKTVLSSLSFREGDVFRRSDLLQSQRNLYESNLFRLATIQVPQTFDSTKAVNVLVREAPLHDARVSAGFNTANFVQTEARYSAYNLLGGARRLDVQGTLGNLFAGTLNGTGIFHHYDVADDSAVTGNGADFLQPTWEASARLQQPAFLQRPSNTFGVGVFGHRRSIPAVVIDRGYGADATLTHTVAPRAPISLTYRYEVTRVEANGPYFCIDFGVCESSTIDALRSHNRLSPLTLQAIVDRSDQPLAPTRGYTARATLEYASSMTASDYQYSRAFGEGALYTRMGSATSVLAFHMRLGFVRPQTSDGVLHPRNRFYSGGANSVRGFGENQLGPRILTLPRAFLDGAQNVKGGPCDATSEAIRFCDPNTAVDTSGSGLAGDNAFTPRPLGGTSLIEGSVEYRFRLPFIDNLGGAVFVDGASVGERVFDPFANGLTSLTDLVKGRTAITPGFGVRYYSPVGAIRVDLGYNPSRAEDLAVVTEVRRNGRLEVVPLDVKRRYDPLSGSTGIHNVLNHLTLHLSIGEAF